MASMYNFYSYIGIASILLWFEAEIFRVGAVYSNVFVFLGEPQLEMSAEKKSHD